MTDRAEDFRAAFDRAFAEAPAAAPGAHADLLRVRIAGQPHVIVVAEISGVHLDVHVTPLPSAAPEFLGIASTRSALVPVFDLRLLLGAAADSRPRCLVVSRAAPEAGLAFDGFDGLARVPVTAVAGGTVVLDGARHQVIDLTSIANHIRTRWDKKG